MVWFNLLKVQTQTQRQGFKLDDKDEAYVLEDDEDCYEKLHAFLESKFKLEQTGVNTLGESVRTYIDDKKIYQQVFTRVKPEMPDDLYCVILALMKGFVSQTSLINWDRKQSSPSAGYSAAPDLYLEYDEGWSKPFGGGNLKHISYSFDYKRENVFAYIIYREV